MTIFTLRGKKSGDASKSHDIILTVKSGGGSLVLWGRSAARGTGARHRKVLSKNLSEICDTETSLASASSNSFNGK